MLAPPSSLEAGTIRLHPASHEIRNDLSGSVAEGQRMNLALERSAPRAAQPVTVAPTSGIADHVITRQFSSAVEIGWTSPSGHDDDMHSRLARMRAPDEECMNRDEARQRDRRARKVIPLLPIARPSI